MIESLQLFAGRVMHERLRPVRNRFVYPAFWLRVRLDAPPASSLFFGWNHARPMSLRWRDYGPRDGSDPLPWLRAQLVAAGMPLDGAVWLQTFPRILGYGFNPVSFYYCHDAAGALRAVLAEVNNTFGDWHFYLLSAPDGAAITAQSRIEARKLMHVSPFCVIEGHYDFRFRLKGDAAAVSVDYFDGDECLIRTAIAGRGEPATSRALLGSFLRWPLFSLGVMARIHWQAIRLLIKRVRFHRQPAPHHGEMSRSEVLHESQ